MNANFNMEAITKKIKQRRIELGMSFQELADLTGMSKSTLQRYETGGIKNIPLDRLKVLAKALQCTPEWILDLPKEETPVLTRKDKRDIQDVLDEMKKQLQNGDLLFDGLPVSDEDTIAIIAAMETAMNIVKQKNKETYTPKKYRKDDGD